MNDALLTSGCTRDTCQRTAAALAQIRTALGTAAGADPVRAVLHLLTKARDLHHQVNRAHQVLVDAGHTGVVLTEQLRAALYLRKDH